MSTTSTAAVRGAATSGNVALAVKFLTKDERPEAIQQCQAALLKHGGAVGLAAEELGIGRRTLTRYMQKYPEIRKGLDRLKKNGTNGKKGRRKPS